MRARLAANQFSRNLTTTMHLLFLLPTRFLSVAKTTGKKTCTWFNGANPQSKSQHGKWSVFHLAQKALGRFLCEKDSWFFFFFITHFFPKNVVLRTFSMDGKRLFSSWLWFMVT
jgi:hypothetical protein